MKRRRTGRPGRPARGVVAVEFALISLLLFAFVVGMVEVGRLLALWNAAAEATRVGARMAAVCGPEASDAIKAFVARRVGIDAWSVRVYFAPNGCDPRQGPGACSCDQQSCDSVSVEISGVTPETFVPLQWFRPSMPSFRTTLTREFLGRGNPNAGAFLGGADNQACT